MQDNEPRLIIFSGILRTYKRALPSFYKNVVLPLNADVAFFCPNQVGGVSSQDSKKYVDFDLVNDDVPDKDYVSHLFGKRLKEFVTFDYQKRLDPRLQKKPPFAEVSMERVASFFWNYRESLSIFGVHQYSQIMLTRPDLAAYRPFTLPLHQDAAHTLFFNIGEGFDKNGKKETGCAPVFPFVNVREGLAIGGGDMTLNDQILFGRTEVMLKLGTIYDRLYEYIQEIGVPPTPETLIGFHMHIVHNFRLMGLDATTHEIIRTDTPEIRSAYLGGYDYKSRAVLDESGSR